MRGDVRGEGIRKGYENRPQNKLSKGPPRVGPQDSSNETKIFWTLLNLILSVMFWVVKHFSQILDWSDGLVDYFQVGFTYCSILKATKLFRMKLQVNFISS